MAKIACMLAMNTGRQFLFVITTTASTRYLAKYFQLIWYLKQGNAGWQ